MMGILDEDFHRKAQEVIKEWDEKFGYTPGRQRGDGLAIFTIISILVVSVGLGFILYYLRYYPQTP